MKNTLIITLGILALSLLAVPANAQTLNAGNVEFIRIIGIDSLDYGSPNLADVLSVTMPSTKDPKWTIIFKDGYITVTTAPVLLTYRPKSKGSQSDEIAPE